MPHDKQGVRDRFDKYFAGDWNEGDDIQIKVLTFLESELSKAREDDYNAIMKIVRDAKAVFFVDENNKDVEIPAEEQLYELRAEIADSIGMYFFNKSK